MQKSSYFLWKVQFSTISFFSQMEVEEKYNSQTKKMLT